MKFAANDTIVAPATASGNGAIALIRLSGTQSIAFANSCFKGKDLSNATPNTQYFGKIFTGENTLLDEVLLTVFKSPKSYTGEDLIEISCHASPYIIQEMLGLFIEMGARMAEPGEFTMRAYLNGKLDLSQAEAVADLIAAESKAGHDLAMTQMRGNYSLKIENLRLRLIDFASLLELELDFSEEDVEFADRKQLRALLEEVLEKIGSLLESFSLGNVIKKGVPTVISGKTNAGKSTLLNALLQEDRAIVSEIEGTTRDTIEETLNINGVLFRFIDTAGIRETKDSIEQTGVQKTFEQIRKAVLILYLFDLSVLSVEEIERDIRDLPKTKGHLILIANKIDKQGNKNTLEEIKTLFPDKLLIPISAKQGLNIDTLKQKLYDKAIGSIDFEDRVIISNARHFDALQKVRSSLSAVRTGLDNDIPSDLIAMDMRQALHYLGSITGAISTDDLLGNIFGKFCVGK